MIFALGTMTVVYTVVLLFLLYGFYQIPERNATTEVPKMTFSIVIPFRNEAAHLPQLLTSIAELDYPRELFEVFLVNDASEDASEEICSEFIAAHPHLPLQVLQNIRRSDSPKKDAIRTAIAASAKEYIITTDADCLLPKEWLLAYNSEVLRAQPKMVAGPVNLVLHEGSKMSFLELFQEMDFFSLQAATIGSFGSNMPFLCNGANLCYKKEAFIELGGYSGNDHISSGDDIFLMQKFQKAGLKLTFLKSRKAVVQTYPQHTLSSLLNQRLRWAAKTSATRGLAGKFTGLLVLLMNLGLLLALLLFLLDMLSSEAFFLMFLFKFNVDFSLIYAAAHFFGREAVLKNYFWCSILYPFFSSYVAIASFFKGYSWKGRQFKK